MPHPRWGGTTAYGPPDDLIFDLRHRRWPLTFELEPLENESIKTQRDELSKNLELAIRAAMQAEHASVETAIGRLDVNCLRWMHDAGKIDHFPSPQRATMGAIVANQSMDNSLIRLLDLGLLRCDVNPGGNLYAYHWTYLGKLVLKHLEFRP